MKPPIVSNMVRAAWFLFCFISHVAIYLLMLTFIPNHFFSIKDAPNLNRVKLFAGEAIRHSCSVSNEIKTIELVIAYCKADLTWMYQQVLDAYHPEVELKMTILSKCGKEVDIPNFIEDHRVSDVSIIPIENVGGCDYAYAYFINYYLTKEVPANVESTVLLFMKDTKRSMQNFHFYAHRRFRTVPEMLNIAIKGEFICGTKTECAVSPYQDVEKLKNWMMRDYTRVSDRNVSIPVHPLSNPHGYRSLKDFHERGIEWEFPNKNLTSVCYGGTFALPLSRLVELSQEPKVRRLLLSLHGHVNRTSEPMTEEHFMERTWAVLFSRPLSQKHTEILRSMQMGELTLHKNPGIDGPLIAFAHDSCSEQGAKNIDGRVIWNPGRKEIVIRKENKVTRTDIVVNNANAVQHVLQQHLDHITERHR